MIRPILPPAAERFVQVTVGMDGDEQVAPHRAGSWHRAQFTGKWPVLQNDREHIRRRTSIRMYLPATKQMAGPPSEAVEEPAVRTIRCQQSGRHRGILERARAAVLDWAEFAGVLGFPETTIHADVTAGVVILASTPGQSNQTTN